MVICVANSCMLLVDIFIGVGVDMIKQNEISMLYFNTCTVHLLLFCTRTNKCTIISQIITLLHVSTLSYHPQGACNQYLAKLHKYPSAAVGNTSYN